MKTATLYRRSLIHHWRMHLATALGVAVATTVLTGALLVGDSVRGSLRSLAMRRLGRVDHALVAPQFFREGLVDRFAADPDVRSNAAIICPTIVARGTASHAETTARANRVAVYGVDARFWQLGDAGAVEPPSGRTVVLSAALAAEIGAEVGDDVLLRMAPSTSISPEMLLGDREDAPPTLRLKVSAITDSALGSFSLDPGQAAPLNAFVPLETLQRALGATFKANAILIAAHEETGDASPWSAARFDAALQATLTPGDLGLDVVPDPPHGRIVLQDERFLLSPPIEQAATDAARAMDLPATQVLSLLANTIQLIGASSSKAAGASTPAGSAPPAVIPYSVVTALRSMSDRDSLKLEDGTAVQHIAPGDVYLNAWAAEDLGASVGDRVRMTFHVFEHNGELETRAAEFAVRGIVPIAGLAADPSLVPTYDGMTDRTSLAYWDAPFPIDFDLIRDKDEDYWDTYGTAPKAFISLEDGQAHWITQPNRFGKVTSIRLAVPEGQDPDDVKDVFEEELLRKLPATSVGLAFQPLRERAAQAAKGSTDFAMLFLGFSMVLIVSAILLILLLFQLNLQRRAGEVGLLLAVGLPVGTIRRLLMAEALTAAGAGAAPGVLGAAVYANGLLAGMHAWWASTIAPPAFELHLHRPSLVIGPVAALVLAGGSLRLALRRIRRVPVRAMLGGSLQDPGAARSRSRRRRAPIVAAIAAMAAVMIIALSAGPNLIPETAAFFISGVCLLTAFLGLVAARLSHRTVRRPVESSQPFALMRLGLRNAGRDLHRSLLVCGLIASATFLLVSVGANRRYASASAADTSGGTGGYELMAESAVPILRDLNSVRDRFALGLRISTETPLARSTTFPLRLRPGDDAGCLSLYRPNTPRLLGAPDAFIDRGGFAFHSSLAETPEEQANPWTLLHRDHGEHVIPAIGDYNTVMWLLHLGLGKDLAMRDERGEPIRLRIVGMLYGSVLQSELIIAETSFVERFPSIAGYNVFMIDTPDGEAGAVRESLERGLDRHGFDVTDTVTLLNRYFAVENTYIATFQMLGGLGMVLGMLGLGVVLLRSVWERRGELALMRAVGFRRRALAILLLAENAGLLIAGLTGGTFAALIAVAPHLLAGAGAVPWASLGLTLLSVLVSGLVVIFVSLRSVTRLPLVPSLRRE